jgi:hypothetical protein
MAGRPARRSNFLLGGKNCARNIGMFALTTLSIDPIWRAGVYETCTPKKGGDHMLIGEVMELTPDVTAMENMATRLADKVRNMWQYHHNAGDKQWEENFFEDTEGVQFLESESFPNLQGIDYIVRWWGNKDADGLAGDLQVLWKVNCNEKMRIFKSTIRFAQRDFLQGPKEESARREQNRTEFRNAFVLWQKLYLEALKKLDGVSD